MNRDSNRQSTIILAVIGIFPVVWLGLLIAPSVKGGLAEILPSLLTAFNDPFHIELCGDSLKTVLVLLLLYGMGIGIYLSTRRNYRRREEHGSAKWGSAKAIDKKYRQSPPSENKLMTQNVRIGLNAKKHRRNLNTLVCGGSGAGKTRFYCKPNLMQTSNSSQVILDPKGEILRDVGNLLEKAGYEIKVLDLISMEKSHCYNPFVYLRDDNDIQRLVTNLFKSTTPKGSQTNDPFWDTAASMLLLALIFYLHYEAPEEEQNFAMVMEMLRAGAIEDEEDNRPSPLDNLFADLEMDNPDHIALKYYRSYHSGSAKTLKSIQITLAARLEKFNLESLAALTSTDELDLASMGEKKTALFALIPDNDSSFNFLVSILYTQLFQQLFYSADHIHGGSLPIPVHFLMDEFANVSLPDDFDKILSVMRSRGVSVSIILQNLAQLKALFEKQWESIVGNCDEFLYLGGNEQSTHKYVSELLGKETIDTNTYGKSEGRSGSYSTNYLKRGFDREYSSYGCPYVQEDCDVLKPSDNLVIYGHHMNNGSMFADLEKFKDEDFWQEHKTITFNTLTDRNEYEILAVFKTVVYTDSPEAFKYYRFTDAKSAEEFAAYVKKCKELSLYDTGVSAEYGDKLITLSTCEYSRTNGRLVVVAKKVTESSGANAPANDGAAEIPS